MRLTRLFTYTTVALIALVGVMLLRIVLGEWAAWRSADDGLGAMLLARRALVVAEKASAERGPANGVLGDADRRDPLKGRRLAAARAVTDGAIADFSAAIGDDRRPARRDALRMMADAERLLHEARAEVDRVAALPKSYRSRSVMGAIENMFDVIPLMMQSATMLSRAAEDAYPRLADRLVAARLAAELREYAGRLGSQFTAALTDQTPLADDQRIGAATMRGRTEELLQLIQLRTRSGGTDPRVVAAELAMEEDYFDHDFALIAAVERASAEHRSYGMDTAQFAARYVPPMASIVRLRDQLLDVAIESAVARRSAAQRELFTMAAVGAITIAVLALFILTVRRRIVAPLLRATRAIVDIAQGRLDVPPAPSTRNDEIGDLFAAVATLRANTLEKVRLEGERRQLFDELTLMSTTDYLTGLWNRRAFADAAGAQLANAKRHAAPYALVMLDLDHFKSVNDRFGHAAGDAVLTHVAAIARAEFREGDIVARFGGEEFAVFAPHCTLESAVAVTERVRAAIERAVIRLSDDRIVNVTASFGVASSNGEHADLEAMLRIADRALYAAKAQGRNRAVMEVAPPAPREPSSVSPSPEGNVFSRDR